MATEYYIIKPETKQQFYLGRRITHLDGIPNYTYNKEPNCSTWEYPDEVVEDLWLNASYFLEGDYRLEQIKMFAMEIYEFCLGKVFLISDCNDDYVKYRDYEEIDVLTDLLKTDEEWCELIELVPPKHWVTHEVSRIKVVHEFETIRDYLIKIKDSGYNL